MSLDLKLLYRGPLSSCNYDCHYCPFAKHFESAEELAVDRAALERFCDWLAARESSHPEDRFGILFTPWGEGLTRRWYREAFIRLSHLSNIRKVAIQTNISCGLKWLEQCDLERVGLWCTWHPTQISREKFVQKTRELDQTGVAYSVGVVGLNETMEDVRKLRDELSGDVYLWVNAYKREPDYYSAEQAQFWSSIDPLFSVNNTRHPSLGKPCRAGESVVSVDGMGDLRRCHFIKESIGNLYDASFESAFQTRACTNETCGCHIGYVHLNELELYDTFGDGVLERIPAKPLWQISGTHLA